MKKFLILLLFVVAFLSGKSVFSAEIFFDCTYVAAIGLTLDQKFVMRPSHSENKSRLMFFLDTNTMTASVGCAYGNEEARMKAVMSKTGTVSMSLPPDILNDYDVIGISYIMMPILGYADKFIGEQVAFKTENGEIKNSIVRGICTSQLMK